MIEAVSSSEMSVNIYQTARRNIPEESHLQEIYLRTFPMLFVSPESTRGGLQKCSCKSTVNSRLGGGGHG
jgi:hypothetical protein